jgi:hypothetical protein
MGSSFLISFHFLIQIIVPERACKKLAALHATGRQHMQRLHATGGHSVTRQEASRQEVCKRPSLHHNYIFFHWQAHILDHASDYSADGPWIFGWENALE